MALIVEDGAAVSGSESYASIAVIDAYWSNRAHSALAAPWAAAVTATKEGAAREATAFLDAIFGPYYRGVQRGYLQGLLWPRSGAADEIGYPLPDLPAQLVAAVAELAARAITAPLVPDADIDQSVKSFSETIGPLSETTVYRDSGVATARYGFLQGIMVGVCDGTQPGFTKPNWAWR